MRREDLSPERQNQLVHPPEYPHIWSLVPPATPRLLRIDVETARKLQSCETVMRELVATIQHLPVSHLITRTLERREAVLSSQMEGTQADLTDLLEYECTGDDQGLPTDVTVTLNYAKALETGLTTIGLIGRQAFSLDLICELHAQLMHNVTEYKYIPGQLRQQQNWIGLKGFRIEDASFVPPPASLVPGCLAEMVDSILQYTPREDEFMVLPILQQLAIAHAQFETIHPFMDGNGRVGRLLMPLMLAAEKYPPLYLSGPLFRRKREYHEALKAFQLQGDMNPWISLLCEVVVEACHQALNIAQELTLIKERWESLLSVLRKDAFARQTPAYLLKHPVVTVKQLTEAFDISFPAANKAVESLVTLGILEVPAARRNRVFVATEVIAALR